MDAANLVPQDFVYAGKVELVSGMGVRIILINDDGSLGVERLYKHSRKLEKMIGGVYTGAKFNEGQAFGLETASWKERWHDSEAIQDWRIKNDHIESKIRTKKLENDSKRINEIDDILTSLRKTYDNYRKIGDYAGMDALEAAVVRSLRKRPQRDS